MVKLLKRIVIVLALALVATVALSIVAPNLFSIRDIQNFFASPQENVQNVISAGTSAAKEATQALTEKGTSALSEATQQVLNQAVDAAGLKAAAEAELRARKGDIAAISGLDVGMVDYVIDTINIENWQATSLPENTYEQSTIPFTYSGTSATLTTYDDPSYITLSAYGQSLTFAVPDTAQSYIPYLAYLG